MLRPTSPPSANRRISECEPRLLRATPPQTVDDGGTTSFTITPDADFTIGTVTGCGGSLAGTIYTTGPITADCIVSATFAGAGSDVIFADGFDGP